MLYICPKESLFNLLGPDCSGGGSNRPPQQSLEVVSVKRLIEPGKRAKSKRLGLLLICDMR
jgi:hypothetical protein